MKVIVLGSGVIGVASAYFLAKAGNEVIVIDKEVQAGLGCSKANGGQLSYSHIQTWAHRNSLQSLLKSCLLNKTCLSLKDFADSNFYRWIYEFYCNSNPKIALENSKKIHLLNSLSRLVLQQMITEENLKFHYKNQGILHFFHKQKDLDKEAENLEIFSKIFATKHNFSDIIPINTTETKSGKSHLNEEKLVFNPQFLNPDECIKQEPNLVKLFDEKKLAGGVFYGLDASGDSAKFTKNLAKICKEKYGVVFESKNQVHNLLTNYKKITGVNTNNGVYVGDCYLYAMGALGNGLLSGIGVETKIYPVKGYSLSIPCDENFIAPNMAMTDQAGKVVYSRLGNQFRIAGTIEMAGNRNFMNQRHLKFLRQNLRQNFSDFGNIDKAEEWQGFRPFRPNSIPLIGCVQKFGNLFLNTGHGSLGWTMAAASGNLIAKLVNGKNLPQFSFLEEELKNL